jgi:quercetin dioxygenase-like cupin family protein
MTNLSEKLSALTTNWDEVPVQILDDNVRRQLITGQQMMLCRIQAPPNIVLAIHSHPHEQITMVQRGRARFIVDGVEREVQPGDILHFPAHCLHGAVTLDEEVVLIDVFTPIRADFLV